MAEYKQSEQLSASVIMSSEVVFDLYCEICSEEGKHTEAEGFCVDCSDHLCRECFKIHRKTRVSRHHQLQDKTTMPQKKPRQPHKSSSSIMQAPKNMWTESCEQHPEEAVKFYCRDHRVLGCSVCMTVGHRACQDMVYIRDITSDLLVSKEYKTFEKELTAMNAKSQDIINNSEENISKAEKCCDNANTSFQQHRNAMIKAFDKLGRDVKTQTEKLKNADVKNMKAISEKGKGVVREIEKIKSDIRKLQENDQLCQLFIMMKQVSGKLETFRDVLQTAEEENTVKTYKFEPGAEIGKIMSTPTTLGKITIEAEAAQTAHATTAGEAFKSPAVPADTRSHSQSAPQATTAVHQRDITVKTITDRKTCLISGSALLPNDRLVLTDWNNKKVKLVNLQCATVTTELKTEKQPWDLTAITADQVAVTVPFAQEILFVKVTETLSIDRKIKVNRRCRGIVYGENKLFVTFEDPGRTEILTLDGVLEKRIERVSQGDQLLAWPLHIALSPDSKTLYVSDTINDNVKRITLDGSVLAVYKDKDMRFPEGLVVDQLGRVIVCGEWSHNIHLLNLDCTKVKVLLSGLSYPESLCFSLQTGLLYVGQHDDVVKVYQLS